MDPHLISATLPLEDQQAINAAIDTLRQKLPFPIDLTAAERVRMAKAADKTATFVRKAVEVANEHPARFEAYSSSSKPHPPQLQARVSNVRSPDPEEFRMIPISPPLRGGVAARSKNSAKPPYSAQTGWWTNHQNIFREIKHHPVRGASVGFADFLLVPQPPLLGEEGKTRLIQFSSIAVFSTVRSGDLNVVLGV